MWTLAHYTPVALFTLKPAMATSSGGKTLLCPTPFCVKMALLDAAIRTRGLNEAKRYWPLLRDLRIQLRLPDQFMVINTFAKIVRPKKNGPADDNGTGLLTPFGSTIAYREYVQYSAMFTLAIQPQNGDVLPASIAELLPQINYLGRRGGFIQFSGSDQLEHELDSGQFTELTAEQSRFTFNGTLQVLDDCSSSMKFEHADIYSRKRITLGKERIMRHIVLPYQMTRSSKGFSLYERLEQE